MAPPVANWWLQALREAGATEVHMRISSPPVTHPCFYGIDTDTQDQLIAARLTVKEIEDHLKVDSLAYLSKEGMVEAAHAESGALLHPVSMVLIRSRWIKSELQQVDVGASGVAVTKS